MGCIESVFAGLRLVCFFEETITLSDQKRGNLNFSLVGLGDKWPDSVPARLSLDNLMACADTGGY